MVRVAVGDLPIFVRALGVADREAQVAVGPDTRFNLASATSDACS